MRIRLWAAFVALVIAHQCSYGPNRDVVAFEHDQSELIVAEPVFRADDNLMRWMASYLAINDFECRYRRYSVSQTSEQRTELLKGNPTKDERGYYLLNDHFLKFRPRDRLYFRKGHHQTAGDGGGYRELLIAHDGSDHWTFVEEVYSGLIKPDADPGIHLMPHPNHLLSADSDLELLYKAGAIVRESDLVYTTKAKAYGIPTPGENRPPKFNQIKFHLSPEHGYMPRMIEVIHESASAHTTYEIESFQKLDGIWFPVSGKCSVTAGGGKWQDITLLEVDVATLKLNQGLKPADFRFEFPAGSGYMNISTGEKVIGAEYKRRQRLSVAAVQEKLEPPKSSRWIWLLCLAVVGCLVLWSLFRRFSGAVMVVLAVSFLGCSGYGTTANDKKDRVKMDQLVEITNPMIHTKISADVGGNFQQEFELRNKSNSPVRVVDLESNCSCLSARLDSAEIPPLGVGRLVLTAQVQGGIKAEALTARFNVTDDVESSSHSVIWTIDRAANWRPIVTLFPLQTMVGKQTTVGPFYFEIGEEIESPELTIEDEDGLFQLAGDVRIITDSELKRRRIEFELTTTPRAVCQNERYMIRVKIRGGEPSYYLLVADMQVSERAYFETAVVRFDEAEKEVVLRCAFEPSELSVAVIPPCYDVEWRWDGHEQAVRLVIRENDYQTTTVTDIAELTVTSKSAEGEEVKSKCILVKPSASP